MGGGRNPIGRRTQTVGKAIKKSATPAVQALRIKDYFIVLLLLTCYYKRMLLDVVVGIHCLLETLVNLLERVEAVGVLLEALEREREDLRSMVEVERRVMLQLVGALSDNTFQSTLNTMSLRKNTYHYAKSLL